MGVANSAGPHLVIAGSARSGTSYLSALLSSHPEIDAGAVKEPNYFSREYERGPAWYERLYEPRHLGRVRLDASVSYTFPHFPNALDRLAEVSPEALVVYIVREPLARALSHYRLYRDYFGIEDAQDFGTALRENPIYLGTSDYNRWLQILAARFPTERVLIVPLDVVSNDALPLSSMIAGMLGLEPVPEWAAALAENHRNDVVRFRNGAVKRARRLVKQTGVYPWLRKRVGSQRLRRWRSQLTTTTAQSDLSAALLSCDDADLERLRDLYASGRSSVVDVLKEQDDRLHLHWNDVWATGVPTAHPCFPESARER
jgi:hypothetical protein